MPTIDWAALKQEADDATKPIDDGEYDIVVEKAELKVSNNGSGNPMIVTTLKVINGPKSGRILFTNIVFSTEKAFALAMWFQRLAAFGLDDHYFARGPELPDIAASLLGRYATAIVGHSEWNGRQKNDVNGFKPTIGAIQPNNFVFGSAPFTGTSGSNGPSASTVPTVPSVPGIPAPTSTPGSATPGPSVPPPVAF